MAAGYNVFAALEAGFAPTPEAVARKMLRTARLGRGDVLYDLGSGDGTLLIMATQEFGARAVGVEIQPRLVTYSRQRIRTLGLHDEIEVIHGDFYEVNVSDADVLTLYLAPRAMGTVQVKLEREARQGARIAVYRYPVAGWTPTAIHRAVEGKDAPRLFLYEL